MNIKKIYEENFRNVFNFRVIFILFAFFFIESYVFANDLQTQKKKVTGVVIDKTGEFIIGANVIEKGTSNGTITDIEGHFELEVDAGSTMIISFIGYKSSEILIGNESEFTIKLQDDSQTLSEVVVVGYGVQKKENLTGAISTTDASKLASRPLTNLGQGLQGLIPGLITSVPNGRPGSDATFNVRGYTSLNGGTPLILVDGVQMDPNQINPSDVENITVLKDAASAAIYGGRAAYGVILITTKKGTKNTPVSINYSYDYTMTRPTNIPTTMNSLDYISMYRYANETGALTGGATGSYNFTDLDYEKAKEYIANPVPENSVYIDPANPSEYRYVANTNWWELQFPGWAPQHQHNLSLSGGTDNVTYRTSFGFLDQKGIFEEANTRFKRYNVNAVVNSKITSWLEANVKISFNRKENNQPANTPLYNLSPERNGDDLIPLMPVRLPNGYFTSLTLNPFAVIESGGRYKYNSNDIWLTGGFTLKPIKNVRIVGDYTWNAYTFNDKNNTVPYKSYGPPADPADLCDPTKATDLGYYGLSIPASVKESSSHDIYSAINIYAQYENTFKQKHYLKAMIGYNREEKHNESFNAYAKDLLNANYPYLKLNNDSKPQVGSGIGEWALLGTFFRLNYIYDGKYLFEINGRYDGTSRFQKNNRYVFTPSASVGWVVSSEKFFSSIQPIINKMKIRASYGKLPNQLLSSNYPYIATMPSGTTSYIFGDSQQSYVDIPGLVSPNFSWEIVSTRNIGMDLSFLNNRLSASFDYFVRNTEDMIVAGQALPAILGTASPQQNAADLRTKGFEFELTWKDMLSNGINYSIGLNLQDNQTEITKYNLNPTEDIYTYYVGKKIGEIWGYETVGLFETDQDAAKVNSSKIWGGKWLAGDVHYADLNGDGEVSPGKKTLSDHGDLKRIGNDTPRYMFGINANLEYKGFDFAMLLQGVAKRDLMLTGTYFWGFTSEWNVPTEAVSDYWTPDNRDAYFPRPRFSGGNQQAQTGYLQNGAYLRVKQLTLGYTLNEKLLNKIGLKNLRLYVTGDNLFVWTGLFKNFDPEQPDRQAFPLTRGLSFGVQVSL